MEAAELDVGYAGLVDVVDGGDAGVEFTAHQAKVNVHGLLTGEAVAGGTRVRHIKGTLYEVP